MPDQTPETLTFGSPCINCDLAKEVTRRLEDDPRNKDLQEINHISVYDCEGSPCRLLAVLAVDTFLNAREAARALRSMASKRAADQYVDPG